MQLLLAEAILLAVVATLPHGTVAAAVAIVLGALVLVGLLSRQRGRWWLERQWMHWRYRRRGKAAAQPVLADDPRLAALRRLAPGLVVQTVAAGGGTRVGVARDDGGWYAVAVLSPDSAVPESASEAVPTSLPLDALAAALVDADQPGAVLQVLTHTVPAPSVDIHPSSPAGRSYHELLARFGTTPVPADRTGWITVRLDARSLAAAAVDVHTDLSVVPTVVAALLRRVTKTLRPAGIPYRLLDADGLLSALARSCDLEPTAESARPAQSRETWSAWRSAQLAHASFWIRGWPPVERAGAVLDQLANTPGAMTSVSVTLAPDDGSDTVDMRALVRVSAPADELGAACASLTRSAAQAGADLFPLDGEQSPAVYASAPTGGGSP